MFNDAVTQRKKNFACLLYQPNGGSVQPGCNTGLPIQQSMYHSCIYQGINGKNN